MKKLKFGSKAYRLKYLGHGKKSQSGGKKKTMAKRKNKSSRKSNSGIGKPMKILIASGVSVLYGAFRDKVADKIPAIPKVENYSDEIILGGGAVALSLMTGNKYVNMVTQPIANQEMGRLGNKIALKIPMSSGANGNSTTSNTDNLY